ncbi:AfsR/SARP family transcriptional regulator [Streptacidiphilus sp. P02-A3a]|uniref:AfsR/SARP family transcriptional regulator n=1 Tax=Streptacidiphilus sp. P02-A3a TaxID=2704468 RepID=UPI0015FD2AD4|nr:AfsR/SARP family transcriptional regulator [Streptacidiphilus sp. P02-A3a]QMU73403.1 AfsR/SARP family transcriptional regulator [Streptacidiphilus sp. P02-A3a]
MIEINILGDLTVMTDGRDVPMRAPMVRRLLVQLLARVGQTVPAGTLCDLLWPGSKPVNARKTLQVYVRRLRQALGEDRVRHLAGGYSVRADPDELDVLRFERLISDGRGARQNGELERASALFDAAVGCWRGTPYAEIADTGLVDHEIDRLEELRYSLLEERLGVRVDLGRYAEAIAELTSLVSVYPYRESLRGLLMVSLYRSGRQSEALGVYQATLRVLDRELGVQPGPGLRSLHGRILRAELPAGPELVPGDRRPRPELPGRHWPVPRQLPAGVAGFIGRDCQLGQLEALLPNGTVMRTALLRGGAGAGKSTLAVHWAHAVAARFPDGQLHADLRDSTGDPVPPDVVLAGFLTSLGIPRALLPVNLPEAAALFRSLLADQRTLVLLDAAASEEQVRPLLPGGGGCMVLVTSRQRLDGLVAADGACPVELDPLGLLGAGAAPALARAAAG